MPRAAILAGVAVAIAPVVALFGGSGTALAATCVTAGNPVGAAYTVPATGVTELDLTVTGAPGAGWTDLAMPPLVGPVSGGQGSLVFAKVQVTPGEVFQAGTLTGGVGAAGGIAYYTKDPDPNAIPAPIGFGGNGGAAQYVNVTAAGSTCAQAAIVAAGGGGAGAGREADTSGYLAGGFGGNADAGAGATGGGDAGDNSDRDGGHGGPASATAGGSGGAHGHALTVCRDGIDGQAGGFESGGAGGVGPDNGGTDVCSSGWGGGGGGAGYFYGGGGGSGHDVAPSGGGGGGSSYVNPGVPLVPGGQTLFQQAVPVGTAVGAPTIVPVIDTTATLSSSLSPSPLGRAVTFTAVVTTPDPTGIVGGKVDFVVDNVNTAEVSVAPQTDGTATASFATSTLSFGTHHVRAHFEGFNAAGYVDRPTVDATFDQSITPAITFTSSPPAGAKAFGATYVVTATDSSSLPVNFSIDPASASVCTISGATVSFLAAGQCVIVADQFATQTEPYDVEARQTVTVAAPTTQTVTFTSTAPTDAKPGDKYVVSATGGGSGNPITFTTGGVNDPCQYEGSGTHTFDLEQGGTCHVFANQAGGNGFAPGRAEQDVAIGPVPDSVIFFSSPPTDVVPGDQYTVIAVTQEFDRVTFSVDPGSTGCTKAADTFSGTETMALVTFTGLGTCILDAHTDGRLPQFTAADASQRIVVKTAQAITFTAPAGQPNPTYGGSFTFGATGGGSGLPVTFKTLKPGVCTYAAGAISFIGTGLCQIQTDEAGNAAYAAAPDRLENIIVAPATLTIVPPQLHYTYGDAIPTTFPAQLTGYVGGDTAASLPEGAPGCFASPGPQGYLVADSPYELICGGGTQGNYVIPQVASFTDLTIAPAPLTITAPAASYAYGSAVPASFTPTYSGFAPGESTASLSSLATCPSPTDGTHAGFYGLTCSGAAGANYAISYVPSTLDITPVTLTVTAPSSSITYGDAVPTSFTPAYNGFIPGESPTSLIAPATCGLTASVTGAGSYPITCSGASDLNYAIRYVAGALTVVAGPPAGGAIITGKVTDAAGTGLPNVCVYPYAAGTRTSDPAACTDAAGRYSLTLAAAGSYDLVFYDATGTYATQWSGGARDEGRATPVSVAADTTTNGVDTTLASATAAGTQITGTVTDTSGVGIANVCAYPYDATTGDRTADPAACTDAAGTYTLNVDAGSYTVVFYDATGAYVTQWYGGGRYQAQAAAVTVTGSAPTAGVDVQLASASARATEITGTVTTAAGQGIPNVCVYPFVASSGARTADPAACTDANGVYHLSVLPGVYNVVFYDPTGAYVTQWYTGAAYEGLATPVPVETGGQATGIDAVLAAA